MKNNDRKDKSIDTGGGAYIGGNVNVGNGKFVGRDDYSQTGIDGKDAIKLFESLYTRIDSQLNLSGADKADLKSEIEELRKELSKKEQANESFIMRRLRNIGRMAPDILEVTLATIANPIAGFGVIGIKIAEKIKTSAG